MGGPLKPGTSAPRSGQYEQVGPRGGRTGEERTVACCRFRGHEDKIVTKELESGYDETEVQPRV